MSRRGLCQLWGPVKAVSVSGQAVHWMGWCWGLCELPGAGWWWMRNAQEKDEAWNRMRMKDRKVLASAGRGKESVRQRWRDWEWGKNEGQRETNLLSKLLMFAPLCCTVASHLNLHLLRQYQVSVSGRYSSSAVKPVKVMSVKETLQRQKPVVTFNF